MTTLITIRNSEGVGRCDAKCYNARSNECRCVCGGMNHGVGLRRAQKHTEEVVGQLLRHGAEAPTEVRQMKAF